MNLRDLEPQHWRIQREPRGILLLLLDKEGTDTNTLSTEVMNELDAILTAIAAADDVLGLVISSAKPSGFIAGADVAEFDRIDSAEAGAAAAARGQAILTKLAALPMPTVAAIEGFALGGGLELALACRYRIAVSSYQRCIGLPEVQLGIHPGYGGTVRLPDLIGAPAALQLMVTGRQLSAVEAAEVGIVDHVVPREKLMSACRSILEERPPRRRAPWWLRLVDLKPLRRFVASKFRRRLQARVDRDHYPAPFAVVDLWEKHGVGAEDAYSAEAESVGRLAATPTARNLLRVFNLRERLRGLASKAIELGDLHVVGAGVMGGDIAAWCAYRGLTVSLQDTSSEAIQGALARAKRLFKKRLRAPGEAEAAVERLRADPIGEHIRAADIAIEAVVENLEIKRSVLKGLEDELPPSAIITSNTSSLRIEAMAEGLESPDRLVGLHFFNPVEKMPLVEVIQGADTSAESLDIAMSFVVQIGKLPLPCRSAPGFVVNRILTPYMLEALLAVEDGHALEEIDAAAEKFGMPVGPIELADQVGLDVAMHVAEILAGTIKARPTSKLAELVDQGRLGRKSGAGFYDYRDGKPAKAGPGSDPSAALVDRLILPLVNEAVACVAEGIVNDFDLLDAAAVFGAGFAPFRGGPIAYAIQRGVDEIVGELERLAGQYGDRFEPHAGWQSVLPNS